MSVPHRDGGPREPIFNALPPAVLILALAIIGAELARYLFPPLGQWIFEASVLVIVPTGETQPVQPLGSYAPYLLHVLVHFGWLHIIMNSVVLVSAGRAVGNVMGYRTRGTLSFLLFFAVCSVLGAVAQAVAAGGELMTLGGASTGVSGLIAASGWAMGGQAGMLRLTLPWIGINLLIGLLELAMPIPIGWAAHIGGAVAGAALFPIFASFARR